MVVLALIKTITLICFFHLAKLLREPPPSNTEGILTIGRRCCHHVAEASDQVANLSRLSHDLRLRLRFHGCNHRQTQVHRSTIFLFQGRKLCNSLWLNRSRPQYVQLLNSTDNVNSPQELRWNGSDWLMVSYRIKRLNSGYSSFCYVYVSRLSPAVSWQTTTRCRRCFTGAASCPPPPVCRPALQLYLQTTRILGIITSNPQSVVLSVVSWWSVGQWSGCRWSGSGQSVSGQVVDGQLVVSQWSGSGQSVVSRSVSMVSWWSVGGQWSGCR